MTKLSDCCNAKVVEYEIGGMRGSIYDCSKCGKSCHPKPDLEQGGVDKCHFCGKPAPNWPGGCVPMCDKCLDDAEAENNSASVDHKDEKAKCIFCGKTYEEHADRPSMTVLKGCCGLKAGFKCLMPVSPSDRSSKPTDTQLAPSEEWEIEQKIHEIVDNFFVVDGKEHHTKDLEKQLFSLLSTSNEKARRERDNWWVKHLLKRVNLLKGGEHET